MKSLKILFLALVLAVSTTTFAHTSNPIPTPIPQANKVIAKFISKQLSSDYLSGLLEEDEAVKIAFQITDDKEIIVMKTNATEKNLDRYIKSRLNYEVLQMEGLQYNITYYITVEFVGS